MRIRTTMAAGVALTALFAAASQAQEVFYRADQYGLVELTLPQSTGFRFESVLANNSNFEPLHEYSPSDPLRRLSRSIGRLDILYARGDILDNCIGNLAKIHPDQRPLSAWQRTARPSQPGLAGDGLLCRRGRHATL